MSDTRSATESADVISLVTRSGHRFTRQSVLGCGRSSTTDAAVADAARGVRVTIFGSARIAPDHWVYGAVRDLATNWRGWVAPSLPEVGRG